MDTVRAKLTTLVVKTRALSAGLGLAVISSLLVAMSAIAQQSAESDPVALLRADAQLRSQWANEWLHSDDASRVAWGAWLVRQDHQKSLVPVLIKKVTDYVPVDGDLWSNTELRDRHDALLAVLDALIELGAEVPVQQARKLYPEFPGQSLILLVRSREDASSELLDVVRNARVNWHWLAAGNVLAKNRTAGFAALVLSRLTQHMTVSVVSPGYFPGSSISGGSECGFSMAAAKAGWPSVGLYWLTQFPERFPSMPATFLISGNTPVYYFRAEQGNYNNPTDVPSYCDDGNRDQYRAEYLNQLTKFSSPAISVDPYPRAIVIWKGDSSYRKELIAVVAKQQAIFQGIVKTLEDSVKILTPAEAATLEPRIELVIRDDRVDRSVPLPSPFENDPTLVVRAAFTKPLD